MPPVSPEVAATCRREPITAGSRCAPEWLRQRGDLPGLACSCLPSWVPAACAHLRGRSRSHLDTWSPTRLHASHAASWSELRSGAALVGTFVWCQALVTFVTQEPDTKQPLLIKASSKARLTGMWSIDFRGQVWISAGSHSGPYVLSLMRHLPRSAQRPRQEILGDSAAPLGRWPGGTVAGWDGGWATCSEVPGGMGRCPLSLTVLSACILARAPGEPDEGCMVKPMFVFPRR